MNFVLGSRVQSLLEVTFLLNLFCSNTIYFRENSIKCRIWFVGKISYDLTVIKKYIKELINIMFLCQGDDLKDSISLTILLSYDVNKQRRILS